MPEPEDLSFDAVTAVQDTDDPDLFGASIHPLWAVGDKPNGGYLLALLGRAARATGRGDGGRDWEVLSSSVTYLRPPDPGPATVRTTLLRSGRTAAHVRAVLAQDGATWSTRCSCWATLPAETTVRYDGTEPFQVPDPEECVRLTAADPDRRLRRHHGRARPPARPGHRCPSPDSPAARDARPSCAAGRASPTGASPTPSRCSSSLDAIPPATLMIGSTGWVPTLQMSTYVRASPGPGLARHPHDGRPRRRRHGRRDLRPLGQPRSCRGAVHPAGPAALPRRRGLNRGTGSGSQRPCPTTSRRLITVLLVLVVLVVGVVAVPRAVPRDARRRRVEPAAGHSCVVMVALSFVFAIAFRAWSCVHSVAVPRPQDLRPRTQKSRSPVGSGSSTPGLVRVLPTASGPPPGSAWGSHRSVPRTWRGATHRGSSRPRDTGRAAVRRFLLRHDEPSIRGPAGPPYGLARWTAEFIGTSHGAL